MLLALAAAAAVLVLVVSDVLDLVNRRRTRRLG
jgi:hypothetical protein